MKKYKLNKKQTQKILATVVMGMNVMNTMTPMAMDMKNMADDLSHTVMNNEDKPLGYPTLPVLSNMVDNILFTKAEAAEVSVTTNTDANIDVVEDGTIAQVSGMNNSQTISSMSGGQQIIENGATGVINNMSGGQQAIGHDEHVATGLVSNMTGGSQHIMKGSGTVENLQGGTQFVYEKTTGTVGNLQGGTQVILGGTATADNFVSGNQEIKNGQGEITNIDSSATGNVQTITGGTGIISSLNNANVTQTVNGGTGKIENLTAGTQAIGSGTGIVNSISGGMQVVTGGNAIISNFISGKQDIQSGQGTIQTINNSASGVVQTITGGTGTIDTLNNSKVIQQVNGGNGVINNFVSGKQEIQNGKGSIENIDSSASGVVQEIIGGTGTIDTLNNSNVIQQVNGGNGVINNFVSGKQEIQSGKGSIENIDSSASGVVQEIIGGTGTIDTLNNSNVIQQVNGGNGVINNFSAGLQSVTSGGTGTINTMNGGKQEINNAKGVIGDMYAGSQVIKNGEGTISGFLKEGTQSIDGGTGNILGIMYGGTQEINNGSGYIENMSGTKAKQNINMSATGSIKNLVNGTQNIAESANGFITGIMDDGVQNINQNASGSINIMNNGQQNIISGNGNITVMNGGSQNITNGTANIEIMNNGIQSLNKNTTATINTMNNGQQNILSGEGNIATMNGGVQVIYNGATGVIDVLSTEAGTTSSGGYQYIYTNGTGHIKDMQAGAQYVDGGSATIEKMSNGTQVVLNNANAQIKEMINGAQMVSAGSANIGVMTNGQQQILANATGTIEQMNSGSQIVSGTGSIKDMQDGVQYVDGGNATIENMNGGIQKISSGNASINTMNAGQQQILINTTANINTVSGGSQVVWGIGTIDNLNGGEQIIEDGGIGTIKNIVSGKQIIKSGGTGKVEKYTENQIIQAGGTGIIETLDTKYTLTSGQTGKVNTVLSGGTQIVGSGAIGYVSNVQPGGQQIVQANGIGHIDKINQDSINTQVVEKGGIGIIGQLNTSITLTEGQTIQVENFGNNGKLVIGQGATGKTDKYNENIEVGEGGTINVGTLDTEMSLEGDKTAVIEKEMTEDAVQIVGQDATGIIKNLNAGMQIVQKGGISKDTVINGGLLYVNEGAIVQDTTINSGTLSFANTGGIYELTDTFTANGGNIVLTQEASNKLRAVNTINNASYETLNIQKMKGSNAHFILDTDLENGMTFDKNEATQNNDKIIINEAEKGTHYIQVKDASGENFSKIEPGKYQVLVVDKSGNLEFKGEKYNAGGLYEYDPSIVRGDKYGLDKNEWLLTSVEKNINNDTRVLLDATDNVYAMWRNTNDSMRSRLGELHNSNVNDMGLWARYLDGSFNNSAFDSDYNLFQLGYDKQADAKSIYGVAIDYGTGKSKYVNGGSNDKLTALSVYAVWNNDDDAYTNLTARIGQFDTELNSYGDYADGTNYKHNAYSLSAEYGKRYSYDNNFYIEPQAQLTIGRLASFDYTTNRGATGNIDGLNSIIARLGFTVGKQAENGNNIYLKADMYHEFAGTRNLILESKAGGSSEFLSRDADYSDTWFEVGVGGNIKLSEDVTFYGDITRGFGGDINKDWQVNGGIRWAF